jgi:hypothetical protein
MIQAKAARLFLRTLLLRRCALVSGAILACLPALGHATELPDAPTPDAPHIQETSPAPVVPGTRLNTRAAVRARRWSDVVNPGERIPRLTVEDKLLFPAHEEFRWTTAVPVIFDAEIGNLRNADPKYGSNAEAFGKRVGASALRQASTRVLTDGLLPIVFREDPRYYRQAYGSYESRTLHALRRVVITQSDSGHRTFNYSDILGRGIGSALTQTYYPQPSVRPGVVMSTWGFSILAVGGGNLFEEFWPDIHQKLFSRGH